MPLGNKALKKRQQNEDAKNGVVRDELSLRKAANAKPDVKCVFCGTIFKVTKKNVDQRNHVDSKHPKETFAACFPSIAEDDAAEAAEAATGAVKKAAAPKKKKKDDGMALLSEGLAGAKIKK
mmetsp:Transcript_68312/g.154540  ORF Transcript_68312/g.154540 Transcript_68312/m.154540 type:complete len:122 (+) Transcript_68312:84-449(+)|eukprot:CAMPEP_0172602126 /NCGR_PEP_ID=MMETSP1068-20121228/22341_1 /TAXON_ID=35684 /ORGANISM="Pseudopedinella elastica, Strain CCMP716" /LENGTH=121 /DNA_ID=CAMNT_0013403395 /DNA_START=5 /DNA_END=370 /DNA_ORIENTATION=+